MKIYRILGIGLLAIGIMSCSTLPDNPLLHKEMTLDSPRYLAQTRYISWVNVVTDNNVIERPGGSLPTLEDYRRNTAYWQSWHERRGSQYRIVDVLPAGTKYHFYKIEIPDNPQNQLFFFYTQIDSGSYKGVQAYYKYDKSQPADAKLLAESMM